MTKTSQATLSGKMVKGQSQWLFTQVGEVALQPGSGTFPLRT